jgi:hypothetical protein
MRRGTAVARLEHGCLRSTPEGDSGAAVNVIQAAGWNGGQRAWELPTRLTCGNAQLVETKAGGKPGLDDQLRRWFPLPAEAASTGDFR